MSACEATPYRISDNVKEQDTFWIKSQPYSLCDMLSDDEAARRFAGGTVYQAYLSPVNYHRWHSPISGTIARADVKEGTYFSEVDAVGESSSGPQDSQAYLAHMATRAIILIDADDPAIGQIGVTFLGMNEVSSCVILPEIAPGRRVHKGDELGYFQFGGSTYCLICGPGVIESFTLAAIPGAYYQEPQPVHVNAKLATVR